MPDKSAVCVGCGDEKPVVGKSVLPDGWTFSEPGENGTVEPMCGSCETDSTMDEDMELEDDDDEDIDEEHDEGEE